MTKKFKYGFEYKGLSYGWSKKELFRLPSIKDKRSYGIKKLNTIKVGNKPGYRVCRDMKTIDQLMEITEIIKHSITVNGVGSDDCPF